MRNFSRPVELCMCPAHYHWQQETGCRTRAMTDFTMSNVIPAAREIRSRSLWLVILAATAAAFILLVFAYFMPHGAISQSRGTLLVVASTALMFGTVLLTGLVALPRGLFLLLNFLIVLDIICTGIVTYFLEAYAVLALMLVALVCWFVHPGPGAKA
jgi:hypothetical protein